LENKAFSAVLLFLFGIGLYLQPIAAWIGLALLLFLRLTKVHSLLLIYDVMPAQRERWGFRAIAGPAPRTRGGQC
jgi:hypothetical protein